MKNNTKGSIHLKPVAGSNDSKTGKPTSWDVSFTVGKHRERKRLTQYSQAQAYQWAEKRRNELRNPAPIAPTAHTFTNLIDLYRSRHLPTLSPAYQDKVSSAIDKRLLPHFGKLALTSITRGTIDDYLASLRPDCQPKAQRDHLALLHKLLSLAVEWELLPFLPTFPKVKAPATDIPEFLTPEEHEQLLASARDHEEYTLLLFATDSGTRSGEQLALSWSDIRPNQLVLSKSLAKGTVDSGIKTTKSGRPRVVPLSDRLQAALTKLRADRGAVGVADDALVFGSYIPSVRALYKRVGRACVRAKVKATSRHGLRHTYASWLISSGKVSLTELQAHLGHSSAAMTQRYSHLIPGTGDNVRGVLDGLSAPKPSLDNATNSGSGLTTD
jgi:integrase